MMKEFVIKGILYGLVVGLIFGFAGGYAYKNYSAFSELAVSQPTVTTTADNAIVDTAALSQYFSKFCVDKFKAFGAGDFAKGVSNYLSARAAGNTATRLIGPGEIPKIFDSIDFTDPCFYSMTFDGTSTTTNYTLGDDNYTEINFKGTITTISWVKKADGSCVPVTKKQKVNVTTILGPHGIVSKIPPGAIKTDSTIERIYNTVINPQFDKDKCCKKEPTPVPTGSGTSN